MTTPSLPARALLLATLVTGEFVLSGADRPDRTGWFSTVWARTPAGWRMIHDHS